MKRALLKDIRNIQLAGTLLFALLTFFIAIALFWEHTINIYKQRLTEIATLIQYEVHEKENLFATYTPQPELIQQSLQPQLEKLVRCYPPSFTIGLYHRYADQVVVALSQDKNVRIVTRQLPATDPGRKAWQTQKPVYTLFYSTIRQAWILKCDFPITIHGEVFGHSFANVTLSGVIAIFMELAALLALLFIIAGVATYLANSRVKRRIQENLNRMLISDPPNDICPFDYPEFATVAQANWQTLQELNRMESEIRESHRKLHETMDCLQDGFFSLDHEWRLTYINTEARKIIRYADPTQMLGRVYWDVYPRLVGTVFYTELHRATREKIPVGFETESIYHPGVWFEMNAYPGADGLSVIFRDVTARRKAEIALQQSRQQLVEIIESITDGFFSIDHLWQFQYINQAGERFIGGKKREQLIGQNLFEQFPDWAAPFSEQLRKRVVEDRQPAMCEIRSVFNDSWLEIRTYPTQNGILIFVSDISQRKVAEQDLADESELLSTTLSSISEAVIIVDVDGSIRMLNPLAEQLIGWPSAETVGKPLHDILYIIDDNTSERLDLAPPDIPSGEAGGQSLLDRQAVLVNRDMREILISFSSSPIRTSQDDVLGRVIVFEDITQKQLTEQELLKAEKLESLGVLAGGIAHDFNNYLAAILSHIQLAGILHAKGIDTTHNLTQAAEATKKASELTRQLLTFSRGGAPIKKPGSISDLLIDTVTFNLHGSNIGVEFAIAPDLWNAEFDRGQISQVISNLVINAKQAMPNGGLLRIEALNTTLSSGLPYPSGQYIKVSIGDQGSGIPREIIDRIFDPFFTTKRDGNGLGLSTCYSIVKKHHGFIEAFSRPDHGTTFTFHLPATPWLTTNQVAVASPGFTLPDCRILVMDDNEMICSAVGESLEHKGLTITCVHNGYEAVTVYRQALEAGHPFDLVLLDLTVPGSLGGQETISHLLELNPEVKAIVSSGYANDPVLSEYQHYGFRGMVSKPYKLDELLEEFVRVLNG